MGKRILGIVVAALLVYVLYYAYQRHMANLAADGTIHSDDTGSALVKESDSSGDTPTEATPVKRNIVQPTTNVQPNVTSTVAAPATDSLSPNAPNGTAFAGTGKFQVYRQGNLTWRLDTDSGATCIVFATLEEWKNPVVSRHACS